MRGSAILRSTHVNEWLGAKVGSRTFGPKPGKQGSNNNFVFTVSGDIMLKSSMGHVLVVPEGTEVCVYRQMKKTGDEIVATIFLPDEHVNIYPGGRWQRRNLPIGART